jgi:WD40 repeat protein
LSPLNVISYLVLPAIWHSPGYNGLVIVLADTAGFVVPSKVQLYRSTKQVTDTTIQMVISELRSSSGTSSSFYITGGTLPTNAPSYVTRRADIDLLEALDHGDFCYVLNTRQMGKSSLMIRTANLLRNQGCVVAVLDLAAIGQNLSPAQWYAGMLSLLAEQVGKEDELDAFWQAHTELGPLQRLFTAIRQVVLPALSKRLVVFVDEIDAVRSLPFAADEFFGAVRETYNRRSTDPIYQKLTFCLIGVATPADLISDTRMSPFNIGRRIELADFRREEAATLAQGIEGGSALLQRVLYWTNGHPYMTQRLCRAIADARDITTPGQVDTICERLFLTKQARDTDDNLAFVRNRLLRSEVDLAALLHLYQQVRSGKKVKDDETNPLVPVLRLSGVVAVRGGFLTVRNRIYDRVFDRDWVFAHLPDAEIRRQREAYRHGVLRTGAVAAVIVIVMAFLTAEAMHQKSKARTAEIHAEIATLNEREAHELADLQLAGQVWDSQNGSSQEVRDLLDESRSLGESGQRFEWRYQWGMLNNSCVASISMGARYVWIQNTALSAKSFYAVDFNNVYHVRISDGRILSSLPLAAKIHHYFSAGISPDGERLAVLTDDHRIEIRDLSTLRVLSTWSIGNHGLGAVYFLDNGRVVAAKLNDPAFSGACWDAQTGHKLDSWTNNSSLTAWCVWSGDGAYRAAANFPRNGQITLTRVRRAHFNDYRPPVVRVQGALIEDVQIADDGRTVAAADSGGMVYIWDTATGNLERSWHAQSANITDVEFSGDKTELAVGSNDGAIRLWNICSGSPQRIALLKGNVGWVDSLAFSADKHWLISTDSTYTARLWNLQTVGSTPLPGTHAVPVTSLSYSPDGLALSATLADGSAVLWDTLSRGALPWPSCLQPRGPSSGPLILCSAFAPDNRTVATSGIDRPVVEQSSAHKNSRSTPAGRSFVQFWNWHTGRPGPRWESPEETGNASPLPLDGGPAVLAFSPDGRSLAGGFGSRGNSENNDVVVVWDTATGREIDVLRIFHDSVRALAFSPDGATLNAGCLDGQIYRFDARSWQYQGRMDCGDSVWSVAFSPNGQAFAEGDAAGNIQLWDARTWKSPRQLTGHTSGVAALAFSPDSQTLASASWDTTVTLWDVATGMPTRTLVGHNAPVEALAFSPNPPDSTALASGDDLGAVILWNAASDAEIDAHDSSSQAGQVASAWPQTGAPAEYSAPAAAQAGWITPQEDRTPDERLMQDVSHERAPGYSGVVGVNNLLRGATAVEQWWTFYSNPHLVGNTISFQSTWPITVCVKDSDGTNWHVMLMRSRLPLASGGKYILQFQVRATRAQPITVATSQDIKPYNLNVKVITPNLPVTTQWRPWRLHFKVGAMPPNHGQLDFCLGSEVNDIELADIVLVPDRSAGDRDLSSLPLN